jgi:hypothetical protein
MLTLHNERKKQYNEYKLSISKYIPDQKGTSLLMYSKLALLAVGLSVHTAQ